MVEKQLIINASDGIHSKPASDIVAATKGLSSKCFLIHEEGAVQLDDIMGLMAAGIKKGDAVCLCCDGKDEESDLRALSDVFENLF